MSNILNKSQKIAGLLALLITALIAVIVTTIPVTGETLNEEEQPLAPIAEGLSCRFGAVALGSSQGTKLPELGAGWYLSFGSSPYSTVPSDIEFVPMIRLKQVKDGDIYLDDYTVNPTLTDVGLGAKIDAHQGATWIVGNEPDRGPTSGSSGQDDMMPDMYARAYHDVYEFIKDRDPSAKVATAGLVEITPGRIQYLDMVSDAYYDAYNMEIPADVWTMHLYAMPEIRQDGSIGDLAAVAVGTNPALGMKESGGNASLCGNVNNDVYCFADHDNVDFFERQIRDIRTWMKAHGHQRKPLLITEYSILYGYKWDDGSCFQDEFGQCFAPSRVGEYLENTFDLVNGVDEMIDTNIGYPQDENRLVQQLMWFSINTTLPGNGSNLYSTPALTETTTVGSAFQAETEKRTPIPNLLAWSAANVSEFIIAPATTATATLSVDIYNNGDTGVTIPITATFYTDEAMNDIIDSALVPNLNGCARGSVSVSVEWSGLPPGVHQYWVKVDSNNSIVESSENDNEISGLVIIDPDQIFLPSIMRQ